MEKTSKLWDLNYEVESLKKVGFLYNQGAPNYYFRGKRERVHEREKLKGNGDAPN